MSLGNIGTVNVNASLDKQSLAYASAAIALAGMIIILTWILANKYLK